MKSCRFRYELGVHMNTPDPGHATPAGSSAATPSAQERQWAMFAHLSILLGGLITTGWGGSIGFFIGPLVIWLLKKDTMPFVADQAKEALNFAISVSIACFALLILTLLTLGIGALLTVPLYAIIGITALVLVIIAAIKANEGVAYRYPFALRLIK
jgi:uncharacterized Tic20 family protein